MFSQNAKLENKNSAEYPITIFSTFNKNKHNTSKKFFESVASVEEKMVSWIKVGTLSLLYFVQGAPYGFQSACLPILLRSQGMSFTTLGIMKLLFLPWVCKPLFAPLVDSYFDKKWWLQKVCEFSSYDVNKNDLNNG